MILPERVKKLSNEGDKGPVGPALGLGVALQDLVDDEVAGKEGGLPVEDVLQHTRQRLDLR